MARKHVNTIKDLEDVDREAANTIVGFFRELGRCITLSCQVATATGHGSIKEARRKADSGWADLAEGIIVYAMNKED